MKCKVDVNHVVKIWKDDFVDFDHCQYIELVFFVYKY